MQTRPDALGLSGDPGTREERLAPLGLGRLLGSWLSGRGDLFGPPVVIEVSLPKVPVTQAGCPLLNPEATSPPRHSPPCPQSTQPSPDFP